MTQKTIDNFLLTNRSADEVLLEDWPDRSEEEKEVEGQDDVIKEL